DSIMSDQLAGQWYAGLSNLPNIVPEENITAALETIYNFNVMQFADGEYGAVNGMRPDGTIDTSSEQSQEVWVGTAYGVAALMINSGLVEEGWQTAYGLYNGTYNGGFWFRT